MNTPEFPISLSIYILYIYISLKSIIYSPSVNRDIPIKAPYQDRLSEDKAKPIFYRPFLSSVNDPSIKVFTIKSLSFFWEKVILR